MNIQNKNGGSLHIDGEDLVNENLRLLRNENAQLNQTIQDLRTRVIVLESQMERVNQYLFLLNERFTLKTATTNGNTTIYNF